MSTPAQMKGHKMAANHSTLDTNQFQTWNLLRREANRPSDDKALFAADKTSDHNTRPIKADLPSGYLGSRLA